jgi:protein MpaA
MRHRRWLLNIILVSVFMLGRIGLGAAPQAPLPAKTPVPSQPAFAPKEVVLGQSALKKPIVAYVWNESSSAPVLVITAMHGDERNSGLMGDRLLSYWKERPEELKGTYVILIPRANPDGWERKTRANANGVDINRNFPDQWQPSQPGARYYSGPRPMSEPETRALADFIEKKKPQKIITIHQPLKNINYDGPAQAMAGEMAKINHYPVKANIGYPTPGSFGIYTGVTRKIPVVTLELPGGNTSFDQIWKDNYPAIMAGIHFPVTSPGGGK